MKQINDWKLSVFYRNNLVFITNGADKYCGAELELNLPLDLKQAERLIDTIVQYCKDAEQSLSEAKKLNAFKRSVRFVKMHSLLVKDEQIWRIVFSDTKGRFPENPDCEEAYKGQLSKDNGMSDEEFINQFDLSLPSYET